MQDRYAGDIGDFGKLGLLRHLVRSKPSEPRSLALGVVWWRVPDEGGNDGRHIAYLRARSRKCVRLRACDDELVVALQALIDAGRRSVAALEHARVLPEHTKFFADPLDFREVPQRARAGHRRAWLERALEAVKGTDVVFLDPDNGLESRSCAATSSKGPKYAYYDELRAFATDRRSLVVYHHADRSGPLPLQIERRRAELKERLELSEAPLALVFRRVSVRTFFVITQPAHRASLRDRVSEFVGSGWGEHFGLVDGEH